MKMPNLNTYAAVLILMLLLSSTTLFAEDSGSGMSELFPVFKKHSEEGGEITHQYFPQKKELLILYEKMLTQSRHTYHLALFANFHGAYNAEQYTTFSGGYYFMERAENALTHRKVYYHD